MSAALHHPTHSSRSSRVFVLSAHRGALVKALAVASHNPYIQVYKVSCSCSRMQARLLTRRPLPLPPQPILLLALEDYYKEPSLECLSRLYRAINSMDTSYLPHLSLDERIILRTSERKDMFEEKFADASTPFPHSAASSTPSSIHQPLGRAPSSNSLSRQSEGSTEVLDTAFDRRSGSSGSLSSFTSASKDAQSSVNGSSDDLAGWNRARSRANTVTSSEDGRSQYGLGLAAGGGERATTPAPPPGRPKDTHWFDSKITYAGVPLPIRIPLATFPEEVGDVSQLYHALSSMASALTLLIPAQYSLIKLVQTFSPSASSSGPLTSGPLHPHLHTNGAQTHPLILLFNALVTHKRIVFLGHGQPAGQVANLVLAACALGSGCGSVLQGFTERAFPYTNLSNLDNLQEVYVAGHLKGPRSLADSMPCTPFAGRVSSLASAILLSPIDPHGGTSSATWRRARLSSPSLSSNLRPCRGPSRRRQVVDLRVLPSERLRRVMARRSLELESVR